METLISNYYNSHFIAEPACMHNEHPLPLAARPFDRMHSVSVSIHSYLSYAMNEWMWSGHVEV